MKYKTGLIFGTFSPLHYGHIRLMKNAKKLCEILIVCTESDDIIREEKEVAPFSNERDRAEDIRGIKYVDEVFIRGVERDRAEIVRMVRPDVLFLGSDWKNKDWVGKNLGVPIEYLPRTKGISSTFLRQI